MSTREVSPRRSNKKVGARKVYLADPHTVLALERQLEASVLEWGEHLGPRRPLNQVRLQLMLQGEDLCRPDSIEELADFCSENSFDKAMINFPFISADFYLGPAVTTLITKRALSART